MRRRTASKRVTRALRVALRIIVWPLQGLVLALFGFCCAAMSPRRAALFGGWLGRTLGPHFRWHRRLRDNLSIALPHATSERVEALARTVWGNFGATLAEGVHLKAVADHAYHEHVEVVLGPGSKPGTASRVRSSSSPPISATGRSRPPRRGISGCRSRWSTAGPPTPS